MRPIPIIPNTSTHTVFPPRAASGEPREYGPAQKHVEGRSGEVFRCQGAQVPGDRNSTPRHPDTSSLSPESLRRAREHYKASELAMCDTCECVHRKGPCPLLAPCAEVEVRADLDPGRITRWHLCFAWFIAGVLCGMVVVGLLNGVVAR